VTPSSQPSDLRVAKATALLVLSMGLVAFAILWQISGHQTLTEQALARGQLGSGRVLRAALELGQMGVTIDPRVFGDNPREAAGLLSYSRAGGEDRTASFPSTEHGLRLPGEGPTFDLLSIVIDPRDWRGENGIFDNSQKRGTNWERGACITLFSGGQPVAESTVGLRVHGGASRRGDVKSLRIYLVAEYGATVASGDLLPGAVGDSLVVHSDQRRLRFCNPISYELMALLGCDVPKTRPVRVMINGELLLRTFFLSEHLSASHIEAKLGHEHFVRVDEQGGHHALQDRLIVRLRDFAPALSELDRLVDVDDVITWLAGVLFCAPYDCRQGVAFCDSRDQRWHWLVWDLDWSFGPWPERVSGQVIKDRNIVAYLDHNWGDIRTAIFTQYMAVEGEFRARLLARVTRALNHELTPKWLESLIEKYRGIARQCSPGDMKPQRNLDSIAAFMVARPKILREELNAVYAVGPVHSCTVRVATATSVRIDGYEYRSDWLGHYFTGQEMAVTAGAGFGLTVNGVAVAGQNWRGTITANTVVDVIPR
jgi:hypothetical protein